MNSPMLPVAPRLAEHAGNPTLALPEQYNAAAFVDGPLGRGWGARVAIRTRDGDTTYAQLAELTNRAGNGLRSLGVEMEQRVGVLLYDSPALAATFFGAIKIGAVPVVLNTYLRPQDYLYMLNDSRARVLVVDEAIWRQIAGLRRELTYLRHVVIVRAKEAEGASTGTIDFERMLAGSGPA